MITSKQRYSYCIILDFALILSSCGSKKYTVKTMPTLQKRLDAMANLKSKQTYRFITDWTGVKYRFGGLDDGVSIVLDSPFYLRKRFMG